MSNAGSARWRGLSLIVGLVIALAAGTVGAQPAYHVSWSKVEEASWKWTAIYSDGGAGPLVHSVVAIMDPAAANGGNLQAVWYIRDDPWASQTWTTADPWEAINSIKAQLGIPNAEDERWEMGAPSNENQAQAQDYAQGFLASDPLGPVVLSTPDPELWIEDLVLLGYPAANVSVDNSASGEVLERLALEFEDMIADGDETVLDLRASSISFEFDLGGIPVGPRPTKPAKPAPGTEPTWSPPGTIPTAPAWTPGTWPTTPGGVARWSCKSVIVGGGTTECQCRRKRRWGRWEKTSSGSIRWHEIIETELCDISPPGPGGCPAGGPPDPSSYCRSLFPQI